MMFMNEPKQITQLIKNSKEDFYFFVQNVWSFSFPKFKDGQYIKDTCNFMQGKRKTLRIAPKDHAKSFLLQAYLAWKILKSKDDGVFGAFYFSYEWNLSVYHLSNLKKNLLDNPMFKELGLKDYKSIADSVLKLSFDGESFINIKPKSLLQFKRGLHEKFIFVDDPFQDPSNLLDPLLIHRINHIFKSQIMDMPFVENGELHVVTTPQSLQDFSFDKALMSRFKVRITPAISVINGIKKELWIEHMNLNELEIRRKERGDRIFNVEYLCQPAHSADSFFSHASLNSMINPSLRPIRNLKTKNIVSIGWDIGKFRHPAHISVFEKVKKVWIQRYQEFMDGWDYKDQLENAQDLVDNMSVDCVFYDATRGELEAFREKGEMDEGVFRPVIFKVKEKWKMANNVDALRSDKLIQLLNDDRHTRQILVVNKDLQAVASKDGHGESFVTLGLALLAEIDDHSSQTDYITSW